MSCQFGFQEAPLAPRGGSEVKKIVYLEPSHCPFICSMAVVASFFLTKETNPYPFDFPVTISLTTRQSLISPKGANAVLKVSVSISGDKSPTKMWWCWDVSTLPCCVPVELVAQLTWNKNWKKLKNHRKVMVKIIKIQSVHNFTFVNLSISWYSFFNCHLTNIVRK